MNWLSVLLCRLGIHGPRVFGARSSMRNSRIIGGSAKCLMCGQRWQRGPVTKRGRAWVRIRGVK